VLPTELGDPYHVAGDDPQLAEALMTPRDAASAVEVARRLREEILRGDYAGTGTVPSRVELGKRHDVSAETASVALRMLAAEGLISLEQGRRSRVLPVRRYDVTVVLGMAAPIRSEDVRRAERRAQVQEDDDPAVTGTEVFWAADARTVRVGATVTAADPGRAAARAMTLAAAACPPDAGWDLAGATVTARPA